jgi:DNA-binding YbaB/EbfC family protein
MSDSGLPDLTGGGMPDLGSLLGQAQEMMAASAAAAEQIVEGSSGGGVVRISVNGRYEFQKISIDQSVVDPADVEMLQDLVLAALRDATGQIADSQQDVLGGIDMGGLGGLLGG